MCVQPESQFAAAYQKGINKLNYWDPVYEDSLNLIAKLPGIAAAIYRNTYKGGKLIPHDTSLDWAANLSHQMGAFKLHILFKCTGHQNCNLSATVPLYKLFMYEEHVRIDHQTCIRLFGQQYCQISCLKYY